LSREFLDWGIGIYTVAVERGSESALNWLVVHLHQSLVFQWTMVPSSYQPRVCGSTCNIHQDPFRQAIRGASASTSLRATMTATTALLRIWKQPTRASLTVKGDSCMRDLEKLITPLPHAVHHQDAKDPDNRVTSSRTHCNHEAKW